MLTVILHGPEMGIISTQDYLLPFSHLAGCEGEE